MAEKTGKVGPRVGKKVYHPFGTATHMSHAYSSFSHLSSNTIQFATDLATSTGVTSEVIEEESPAQIRRRLAAEKSERSKQREQHLKNKAAKKRKRLQRRNSMDSDEEEDESEEESDEDSDSVHSNTNQFEILDDPTQPACVKIACQQVARAIAEIHNRNRQERIELQDQIDQTTINIADAQKELDATERNSEELSTQTLTLETNLERLELSVKEMEKKKEILLAERSEITTKIMHLELEKQKAIRENELAQTELRNAKWKRKNAQRMNGIEDGLSVVPSSISEGPIIHSSASIVSAGDSVYDTSRAHLAREYVRDVSELPPGIKTIPPVLQEHLFVLPVPMDPFSRKFQEKQVRGALESWQKQEGTELSMSIYTDAIASTKPIDRDLELPFTLEALAKRKGTKVKNSCSACASPDSSVISRKTNTLRVHSSQLHSHASLKTGTADRVGSLLQSKSMASSMLLTGAVKFQNSSMRILDSIHSLLDHVLPPEHNVHKGVVRECHSRQNNRPSSEILNQSMDRSPSRNMSRSKSRRRRTPQNGRLSPLQLGSSLDGASVGESFFNGGCYSLDIEAVSDRLAEDGIHLDQAASLTLTSPSHSLYSTQSESKSNSLDPAFYRKKNRNKWGTRSTVGVMQPSKTPTSLAVSGLPDDSDEEEDEERRKVAALASVTTTTKSGQHVIDTRILPRVHSRTLTVKHPGMQSFDNALHLSTRK